MLFYFRDIAFLLKKLCTNASILSAKFRGSPLEWVFNKFVSLRLCLETHLWDLYVFYFLVQLMEPRERLVGPQLRKGVLTRRLFVESNHQNLALLVGLLAFGSDFFCFLGRLFRCRNGGGHLKLRVSESVKILALLIGHLLFKVGLNLLERLTF